MKIQKGKINIDDSRDLYWTRVVILSDDESRKTEILACSSEEYLRDRMGVAADQTISEESLNAWLDSVIEKWSVLGSGIFDQDIHYDVYTTTEAGENIGFEFLFNLTK